MAFEAALVLRPIMLHRFFGASPPLASDERLRNTERGSVLGADDNVGFCPVGHTDAHPLPSFVVKLPAPPRAHAAELPRETVLPVDRSQMALHAFNLSLLRTLPSLTCYCVSYICVIV